MRRTYFILSICCLLLAVAGCDKNANTQSSVNTQTTVTTQTTVQPASVPGASPNAQPSATNADSDKAKFDVCALLKKEEIQSVQGSPVKDTKSSERSDGAFRVSQCFYSAEDFSKSVSLSLTQSDPDYPTKRSPKEFWAETFHRNSGGDKESEKERARDKDKARGRDKDKEKDKEREQDKGRGKGEEEEESTPPKKITGIGDEAYWTGSRVGGALYVLEKDTFIRVSLGGPDKEEIKINKSKTLAQKALQRL